MDLVEGGDVRRLFSDAELLDLAEAEEKHEARNPSGSGNMKNCSNGHGAATDGGRAKRSTSGASAADEALSTGGVGDDEPGSSNSAQHKVGMPPMLLALIDVYVGSKSADGDWRYLY